MKTKLIALAIVGLSFIGIQSASAHYGGCGLDFCRDNWYISGLGEVSFQHDLKTRGMATGDATAEFKVGGGAAGAFGYMWDDFRFEAEVSYRMSGLDTIQVPGSTPPNSTVAGGKGKAKGRVSYVNVMFNAFYDFPIMDELTFYLGGGIGYSYAKLTAISFDPSQGDVLKGGNDNLFAYQGMTGLSYDIDEMWTIFAGYRIFGATRPKFGGASFKTPLVSNLDMGIRLHF